MNDLERRICERTARIAVVGIGYAGLPMAIELARAGFTVAGYDLDVVKVAAVMAGRSPVSNVTDPEIQPLRATGRLSATTSASALASADVVFICVPTPLKANGEPDMGFVARAGSTIGANLQAGSMVILQSTCAPGTTSQLLKTELERTSDLVAGQDFQLVFAPERIDPGNTRFTVSNTPKLVGGTTREATRLACMLFETFIDSVVPVASPEVAEMAKLVENTFRFINISFINEMALLCDRIGVNVWEVIEAAKTKPFAFMPHYPSAGVGGHCIPVVPRYLEATGRQYGVRSELIEAANHINDLMPSTIVDKLEAALVARGKSLSASHVLVVGVTYKPDMADVRESAALRVLEEAQSRGASASYHDPLIPEVVIAGQTITSCSLTPNALRAADAVVLLTAHSGLDYEMILRESSLVIDTHSPLQERCGSNVVNVWLPRPSSNDHRVVRSLRSAA